MDEVRLGLASVNILPVVRGLPSEKSTVAEAIRTTDPNVVALSIGPEELQTLRVYRGGPLEPENFEEEIYVAGLSAWEWPVKPPPCFTEAIRISEKRGTRLEALDMDDVTYTENYVDGGPGRVDVDGARPGSRVLLVRPVPDVDRRPHDDVVRAVTVYVPRPKRVDRAGRRTRGATALRRTGTGQRVADHGSRGPESRQDANGGAECDRDLQARLRAREVPHLHADDRGGRGVECARWRRQAPRAPEVLEHVAVRRADDDVGESVRISIVRVDRV